MRLNELVPTNCYVAGLADIEKQVMRRVIARRCFVPETSVTVTEGRGPSRNPQVAVRVTGSPLPSGARDAAMHPATLLQEVNTEMSQPNYPMMNPIVMQGQPPMAQLGFKIASQESNGFPIDHTALRHDSIFHQ